MQEADYGVAKATTELRNLATDMGDDEKAAIEAAIRAGVKGIETENGRKAGPATAPKAV